MMRVISGGVDYALGLEKGLSFGMQEILGVTVDMDLAGRDALNHDLVYLDDSRRDMAAIQVPVTWIHGTHDAWMDQSRVRDVMSRGETKKRRFVTVPTGHMLRTSSEALDTFRLITSEVAAMISEKRISPVIPALGALENRRVAERKRLDQRSRDLRKFWHRYLMGENGLRSFELMTAIAPYRDMMSRQIDALAIPDGGTVVDLGSGTGAFPIQLLDEAAGKRVRVIEVDYVVQGLLATRDRISHRASQSSVDIREVVCNLDFGRGGESIALRSGIADAVIASLLLSYVSDPQALVAEAVRLLRPGGRLVVSSLSPDADMSKLFRDGLEELRSRIAKDDWVVTELEDSARAYLNHASRLLDLEEAGDFRFLECEDLEAILRSAGLRGVEASRALGDPAQAIIVSGCRA